MTTIAQDLGGVVRLLEKATPGEWQVIEDSIPWSFSDGRTGNHTQRRIFTAWDHPQLKGPVGVTNIAYGIGLHDAEKKGVQFVSMSREDADAIVSCIAFLRTHSAEIAGALRDAEGWQPIETAPRDGSRILAMIRWSWSDGTDGEAQDVIYWCAGGKFWVCGTPMNYVQGLDEGVEPTHWRPLPAPPTQDSAMQQGGGGEK